MRTLCLNPDFDAVLFWRDEHSQTKADQRTLPLSDGLRQRLDQFYRSFSELHLTSTIGERASPLDDRLLDSAGIELWERLRSELQAQYRVIYYSCERAEYFDTPELFRAARNKTQS